MKLFRPADASDHWIGEDAHGALMTWPASDGGWAKRTAYTGPKRGLVEVEPALARGTRWPGAGRARLPRASSGEASNERVTLRSTAAERAAWQALAESCGQGLTVWARDELNAAVARAKRK
jgi:hypothetical protein